LRIGTKAAGQRDARRVDNNSAFLFAVNGTPSRELASARSSSSQEYERRK